MRILVASLACAVCAFFVVAAAPKDLKCPVSGGKAKEDISLEVNGKKVHFCCNNCPKKYKKQINVVAKDAVKKCPVSGQPGKEKQTVIVSTGKKVAFCCDNCPKGFAEKNGFEIKETKPGKCPVSGGPAKDEKGTSLVVNGNKVFFCCANCPKKYQKQLGVDPAAKVAKCAQSGRDAKEGTEQIVVTSKEVSFCCGDCQGKWTKKNIKDGAFIGAKKGDAKKPARI